MRDIKVMLNIAINSLVDISYNVINNELFRFVSFAAILLLIVEESITLFFILIFLWIGYFFRRTGLIKKEVSYDED